MCVVMRGGRVARPSRCPLETQSNVKPTMARSTSSPGQTHLKEFDAGNGENTLAYLQWLRKQHEGKRLLVLWDGASYHRDRRVQEFFGAAQHRFGAARVGRSR